MNRFCKTCTDLKLDIDCCWLLLLDHGTFLSMISMFGLSSSANSVVEVEEHHDHIHSHLQIKEAAELFLGLPWLSIVFHVKCPTSRSDDEREWGIRWNCCDLIVRMSLVLVPWYLQSACRVFCSFLQSIFDCIIHPFGSYCHSVVFSWAKITTQDECWECSGSQMTKSTRTLRFPRTQSLPDVLGVFLYKKLVRVWRCDGDWRSQCPDRSSFCWWYKIVVHKSWWTSDLHAEQPSCSDVHFCIFVELNMVEEQETIGSP